MRISYRSTVSALVVRTQRRIADILPAIRRSEQETGVAMRERCRQLSQGPISTAELRRMRHPYARRNPQPPMNPAIINLQSGAFARSWHYRTDIRRDMTRLFIFNTSPEAKFMLGTRFMIARPILAQMVRTEGPARFARLARAFNEVYFNP